MKRQKAFTLIEVLVVVGIIALLVGILMPSLSAAKRQARLTSCAARLHQVGLGMMAYMQDSRDRMPHVSYMPSVSPAPCDIDKPSVYLADVLKKHLKSGDAPKIPPGSIPPPGSSNPLVMPAGTGGVLECPDDTPGKFDRDSYPGKGWSYYQTERASYAYRSRLAGLTPSEFGAATGHMHGPHRGEVARDTKKKVPPQTIWFANDYNNFHGKAGQVGARRYVYIDGHVSDFEN